MVCKQVYYMSCVIYWRNGSMTQRLKESCKSNIPFLMTDYQFFEAGVRPGVCGSRL
jgi:hypothetical protein